MHDDGVTLHTEPPRLDEYLRLRAESGLTPKRPDQGELALANSWAWAHLRSADGEAIAMGRVIGDGGWYFVLADVATLPAHQRRGHARRVLEHLLAEIDRRAPENPYVTLVGDPPGQALYRSLGFRDVAPSLGMQRYSA
jgi:ribosomal protein S18 acetylase RimI-like enzyme